MRICRSTPPRNGEGLAPSAVRQSNGSPMERTGIARESAASREEAWPYRIPQGDPWGRESREREVSCGFRAMRRIS